MIPIDSPDLQILPKHFTTTERAYFLRNISLSRAFYYANKKNAKLGVNSIRGSFADIQRNYFVTQITIGTHEPPFTPVVILDTSVDQTWIQCATCKSCFTLKDSFPMEESTSYSLMNPEDSRCSPRIIYDGSCGFEASYGKGHTKGYLGIDTFSFTDTAGQTQYFSNIAFGCGIENKDFGFGNESGNVIAGVHGLGIGPKSIMTQMNSEIKGRFTYCISSDLSSSTIVFGDDAQIKGDDARKVQTIAMDPDAHYHLYLAAITVEGVRLPIDPYLFELDKQDYTSGFFIDPGATFMVLTNTAYLTLRTVVEQYFSKYEFKALATDANMFDLCYPNKIDPNKGQVYPSIIFNFIKSPGDSGEVDLPLDPDKVFGNFVNENGFCMQILPTADSSDGPSIFGAYQQADIQFLFDVDAKLLSFVPQTC
ncbi:aspartic proteinase nepenthesin-1-like [Silene latifolia]|uniref:aspartic proteinase nepenthesin-1-like n=1 Tax=Silene latifolia TaxID=37657 RepID=UPI003D7715E9